MRTGELPVEYALPFEFPPSHGMPANPLIVSSLWLCYRTLAYNPVPVQGREGAKTRRDWGQGEELVTAVKPSYSVITLRRDAQEIFHLACLFRNGLYEYFRYVIMSPTVR